ncbi:MAG TPA: aminotransferase class IV [Solirubrobacterales bacterium]|nr:aminotransferase class IV [Solirubrobacterales bacterium]
MPSPELTSVDGRITDTGEARIPAADDGLLRGDGVFEVIRLYDGRPFALDEHLDRLERSAAAIELPVDRGAFEAEIAALLAEFGPNEGQLRLVATRGGRRLAFTENLPPYADRESITLASATYAPTQILNGVKSLSYAANMQASRLAAARGADEAVLVRPDGVVLEAPTSTVFWVSADGRLRTPSLDVGILASITRDRLVREIEVEEAAYPLEELLGATEAFLASTVREVQAVSAVDETQLPECPGRRTREAADAFSAILGRELAASASG